MMLRSRSTLAVALVLLLVAGQHVQRTEGTFFVIGGACVLGLQGARAALSATGALAELARPIEQVTNLCRFIQRYSLGGILIEDVLPRIERLVRLTGRGALRLANPANLEEFRDLVTGLAEISEQVTPNGG